MLRRAQAAGGRRSAIALALAVLVAGLGATYLFRKEIESEEQAIRHNAFELRADATAQRIETRLHRYEEVLGAAAALAALPEPTRERSFQPYLDSLRPPEHYPEVRAIGLAWPAEDSGMTHARILYRDHSANLASVEPDSGLGAEPARRAAMARARDTGDPALSAMIPASGIPGDPRTRFDVFFPIEDGAASSDAGSPGWVFAEVSSDAMVRQILGDTSRGLAIRIRDVHGGDAGSGHDAGLAPTPGSGFSANRGIAFGGREWSVEVRAAADFDADEYDHATLLGIAGVAGSLLLASLVWLLATGRSRAVSEAAQMNRDLLRSETRLRELNEDLERRVARRTRELETYAERLALAVHTSNTGLWDLNVATGQVHYSAEWAQQLGLEPHEPGTNIDEWKSRIHPDDRERALQALQEHTDRPGGTCEMELRLRHRDGSYRTILCRSRSYADPSGGAVRIVGSHLDITERKRSEDALAKLARELRQAWRQVSQVEEAERRHLASELHDSIGAALTALNLNLTIVRARLPEEARPTLDPRLGDCMDLLEETVETMRGLMAELRPPVLDDYGLATALRWYLDQVASRADLNGTFRLVGEDARLPAETEIALFRIAQGALTNVVKHAEASHVAVTVEMQPASLRMSIVDDGRGFAPEKADAELDAPHWGLVTMRERAESIGGRCTVDSCPGKGTRVEVELRRAA